MLSNFCPDIVIAESICVVTESPKEPRHPYLHSEVKNNFQHILPNQCATNTFGSFQSPSKKPDLLKPYHVFSKTDFLMPACIMLCQIFNILFCQDQTYPMNFAYTHYVPMSAIPAIAD